MYSKDNRLKKLVYISPVPWDSFAQRPQKFVEWFKKKYEGEVLWINPYATRLPNFGDIKKLHNSSHRPQAEKKDRIKIINTLSAPIEPVPYLNKINFILWRKALSDVKLFAGNGDCTLVIGKPSLLALQLISLIPWKTTIYDAMDDFPAFYHGLARISMARNEMKLVQAVDKLLVSSTHLFDRWHLHHNDVSLIPNGLDIDASLQRKNIKTVKEKPILGYIGTIGDWFDWELVITLARIVPLFTIRIIGPVHKLPPETLPHNIEILPPCDHKNAMLEMSKFDVGLIPFLKNELTDSVDPIKYYEYRSFSIPILSTNFGEMKYRRNAEGVHLIDDIDDALIAIQSAIAKSKNTSIDTEFLNLNSWDARFNHLKL